jgi:hypothetical protein
MEELQSDDLYIPAFLLNSPPDSETDTHNSVELEDITKSFMKNIASWSECCLMDESLEKTPQ